MGSYMPQEMFEIGVLMAIKLHTALGNTLQYYCDQLFLPYKEYFQDDTNLRFELEEASTKILQAMLSQFQKEELPAMMTQLQFLVKNYKPDGKKRTKPLFGRLLFNSGKTRNPNRSSDCVRNIFLYHIGTINCTFLLAPDGWSLKDR